MDNSKDRTVFVRRHGRTLSGSRQVALEHFLPITALPPDFHKEVAVDPKVLFDFSPSEIWVEIGFGSGEHLAGQIKANQNVGFIGAEPFVNGVSTFFTLIDKKDALRVRIEMDDAVTMCTRLETGCVDRIYILNPDPWHKKRHHKRRIVRPETLDTYARILRKGGKLILSSDVEYLGEWLLCHTAAHESFEWQVGNWNECYNKPEGWITTRYEVKGAKGAKRQAYFIFERV